MGLLSSLGRSVLALAGGASLREVATHKHYVSTSEGWLDTGWPATWWQEGRDPLQMGNNAVVEACIQTTAQAVATPPLLHQREDGRGGWETLTNSDVAQLIRSPNAFQTRSDFLLNFEVSLLAKGNAYVYLGERAQDNRLPDNIYLLNPTTTRPYRAPDGSVFYGISSDRWTDFTDVDVPLTVPARDIAHCRLSTGHDPLIGVSPIESAVMSIQTNDAIWRANSVFYQNQSRPSGILTTDLNLTRQQMMELRTAWSEQSKGVNQGQTPVLANGLKWQALTLTNEAAQLAETVSLSVQDISRVFRVPLPLINDMTGSTFNNAEAIANLWLATGLGFQLSHLELCLEKAFRLPVSERLHFDEKALLKQDFVSRMDALGKGTIGGVLSPDEARNIEGLPKVPGGHGEEPRVQQQVVPLSAHAEQMELDKAAAEREEVALEVQQAAPPEPTEEEVRALIRKAMDNAA